MPQLLKVNCLLGNQKKWEGIIILYDNGWFEGLAPDPNNTESIIFGSFHPNQVIELYSVNSTIGSEPFLYHGVYDESIGFSGFCKVLGIIETTDYCSFVICVEEILSEDKARIKSDINGGIEARKNRIKGFSGSIYSSLNGNKGDFSQKVLQDHLAQLRLIREKNYTTNDI